jgi:hypothetical protein
MLTYNVKQSNPEKHIYFVPHHSQELHSWALKHYIQYKCPFKLKHPLNNVLIYVDFICKYSKYIERHTNTNQELKTTNPKKIKNCVVLVDTRYNVMSLWSLLITLHNIRQNTNSDNDWQALVYTSPKACSQYKNSLSKHGYNENQDLIKIIECPSLECNLFHMEMYNAFLKNEYFWKDLMDQDFTKCLIIQDDGMLISNNNFDEYLMYDYVGAPWTDVPDNAYIKKHINTELVGNGGFSLRDVALSYKVCSQFQQEKNELFYHNINEVPEDIYFVNCFKKIGGKIATFDVARKFSVEQVYQHKPCGFHKFWMYHSPQDTLRLCNSWL